MRIEVQFTPEDWKMLETPHALAIAQVLNDVIVYCVQMMHFSKAETEKVVIAAMTGYAEFITGESYAVAQGIINSIYEQNPDLSGGSPPGT